MKGVGAEGKVDWRLLHPLSSSQVTLGEGGRGAAGLGLRSTSAFTRRSTSVFASFTSSPGPPRKPI